ncbi:MAG: sporulation protein YqfD [Clostridia bacterium]|nr:sporulation protein YqfD [Clostridia bacterium]
MLFLNFVRFLLGYVSFTARGGFPERFINLCRLNKIILWDLKNSEAVISACTDCASYKKIRSAARKSGMRVRVRKKHGLPFFLERHKRRIGVVAGALFCAAVILILSTRIWSIDVIGNLSVPPEKILGTFEELGVKKGVSASRIDIKSTEFAALQRLNELSWLNINISGSKAVIEVREAVESPEIDGDNVPADIVAARDGIITIIRPFNGTAEQEIGNAVVKGDLLISGIEENGDLTVSFCKAKGYVVARTSRSMKYIQPEKFIAAKPISSKKRFILNFLSFEIPLGKIKTENSYSEKSEIIINGVTLPAGIIRCVETVYEEKEITLSAERRKMLSFLRFTDMCAEEFRYLEVENAEISVNESGEFSGAFTCLENIGKEHPMQLEEAEHEETADP